MSQSTSASLLELYERGVLTRAEATFRLVSRLGIEDVWTVFPRLSAEFQSALIDQVREAPVSDMEWAQVLLIGAFVPGREVSVEELERARREEIAAYRSGVEAIRAFLQAGDQQDAMQSLM